MAGFENEPQTALWLNQQPAKQLSLFSLHELFIEMAVGWFKQKSTS